jgi:nucleoside-diphosphate-sugar epimerase
MAGLLMKQRILVLGAPHFAAAKVQAALARSDWAVPVPFANSPDTLSETTLADIQGVFNGSMGSPVGILATAQALYGALQRAHASIRVVHLSSMTVYGSFEGQALESTELRADLGAYGAAQIEAEALATRYAHSVILRPGCEYGPQCPQWSERIARLLVAHRLGDLGAAGDGVCNLLFVDDLVAAVLASLRTAGIDGERFNLAMRSPPTWNEYFMRFGRALGAVPIARIGGRRLKVESKLLAPPLKIMELIEQRLRARPPAVPPPLTPSLLHLCAQSVTLDVTKAEQALGLAWTPLGEGLRQAAMAYRANQ